MRRPYQRMCDRCGLPMRPTRLPAEINGVVHLDVVHRWLCEGCHLLIVNPGVRPVLNPAAGRESE